jgi:hypothetical protein
MAPQRALEDEAEELTTSVCLNPLHRERELLEHPFLEEVDRVGRRPRWVQP